jgi:DNA-binding MarR family transcriptional regulator
VPPDATLTDADFRRLLGFRTELRRFLQWSEEQARREGLTPAQHQLLLAVRGFDGERGPTVGDVADLLLLQHHSATGLVDRTERAGLIRRERDPDDGRVVHLRVTRAGAARLARLSRRHLQELERLQSGTVFAR